VLITRSDDMSLAPNVIPFPTPGEEVPSGFVHLPNAELTDTTLSAALRVYWAILAGHTGKERSCYPAQARLARLVGCTARQIRTYNAALVARDLLTVEPRKGTCNAYHLPVTLDTEGTFTRVSSRGDRHAHRPSARLRGSNDLAPASRAELNGDALPRHRVLT
jgi:hypothetical protein